MTEGHHPLVCEDCGESPTLVALDGGVDYGVECDCERAEETPIGCYVDVPSPLPDRWQSEGGR